MKQPDTAALRERLANYTPEEELKQRLANYTPEEELKRKQPVNTVLI